MQDRPTAPELLDAVRAFLEDEVAPDLSGRRRFHMRVVLNVLQILEREWTHEPEALRAEHDRLTELLGLAPERPTSIDGLRARVRELNAGLAAAVRSGQMDDRWPETLEAVYETTVEKLRIANPGWEEPTS